MSGASNVTIQLPRGFVLHLTKRPDSYCTSASIVPPLPVEIAARLADATQPQFPLYSEVLTERVGEVIRAHGDGRGPSGDELATYGGGSDIELWHVDDPVAVGFLVAWLIETISAGTLDAATADVEHRRRYMTSLIGECEREVPNMLKGIIVDGEVDDKVIADAHEWIELKARFRKELGGVV